MRASRGDSQGSAGVVILLFLVLSLATLHSGCAGVTAQSNPGGPTASITSPTSGATVSASTTVSANASASAVGVQFKLDGSNLGSEKTSGPFSISWDATTTANGQHVLTAAARNAAGQTTTSAPVTITVQNSSGGGPTVSITSPISGATVSGAAAVTASASSAIGIAGVQFLLDGANLGAEVTTSPYSVAWDTTGTSNGAHALAARARDTAGITASSVGVTVTVSNGSGGSTFQTRCAAPGVIRCVGFDSPADISGVYGNPTGILPGSLGSPTLDTTVMASGASSLKMTIPSTTGAASDPAGSYFANFSDNLLTKMDSCNIDAANCEFYIQWRQRMTPGFANYFHFGDSGWKQAIIGAGDNTGCSPGSTASCFSSCTDIEVVDQNTDLHKFAQLYHSCGAKDNSYEGLQEPTTGFADFYLQNAIRNPGGCVFSNPTIPPCIGFVPNTWMTFQIHVKVGTWYVNNSHVYKHDSIIQMWVAQEGQPSVLILDFSPQPGAPGLTCQQTQVSEPACQTGYDLVNTAVGTLKYGKIWLTAYQTSGWNGLTTTEATWYDELIISKNKIVDP